MYDYLDEYPTQTLDEVPAEAKKTEENLRTYLTEAVQSATMKPSNAIELYCEANKIGRQAMIELATEDLGFDPYFPAAEEIDIEYLDDDISDMLDYLRYRYGVE